LRSDISEPSYMRTKLMSDIHNKLGLPSLSANYILLYINDEFIGLYILTDVYKETWIEHVYGEKDTKNLYKCDSCSLTYDGRSGFENENKEATDKKELYEFLAKLTTAESWTDVESIFDIDQFYKEVAIDYLAASFDHINSYHNFYVYKNPQNNKWIYLVLDFDFDLGWTLSSFESDVYKTFEEYLENEVAYKLIYSNYDHFIEILKEIVVKVFNPATLFPRIDELKSFIRPYVKLDKTPNSDGKYPGRMNINDRTFYTMEEWEASTEYDISQLGLKQFILLKYKFVCQEYNIECDPNYLDNNNNITITETELLYPTETSTSTVESTFIETTTSIEDTVLPTVTSIFDSNIDETTTSIEDSILSTATSTQGNSDECWSEIYGYPCCSSKVKTVYAQDEYGDWGYDFTKNEWCGLAKHEDSSKQGESEECWSEIYGYPCCKGCRIYETDSNGSWGYEFNEWCGIISSRC
ncbi:hypothetical protein LY90DRAFT_433303, partial [Neocallimastix californiae]